MSGLPPGWAWATLDELAAPEPGAITDGPFGSNLRSDHYTASGARVIRLQNIGDGEFRDDRSYISLERFQLLRKHEIRAGDLAFASLSDTPPRVCIMPRLTEPAIVKADCIRVRLHPEVSPYWVLSALMAEPTRTSLRGLIKGVGRPRLGLGHIRAIAIPVPPSSEQQRIAESLGEYFSRLDVADRIVTGETGHTVSRSSALRSALLRTAFHGDLVDQEPASEPADVLLARICAEREAAVPNKPQTRRTRKTRQR